MTTFLLPSFWLFFIAFFFAIFFAFYIPGNFFLKENKLTSFQRTILSIIIGLALWGWQGFVFGFLQIRWMTYIYLLVFFILWVRTEEPKQILETFKNFKFKYKPDLPLILLVAIGTLLQMLGVFFLGILTSKGMYFCCSVNDSLYHIALTNQLVKEFPPTEPGMAGIIVHNYHYLSNLVSADLIRIFYLPLIATQFQYFVFVLSLLIGLTAIVFGQILNMKKPYILWLVFFLYFSGDMTYILAFFAGRGLNFNTPYLENALWLWNSPPRVFATDVLLGSLSLFVLWIKQKKVSFGILLSFVLATLISFKVYDGVFALTGAAVLFIYFSVIKQFRMAIPMILSCLLSLIFYLPVNANSGGFVFTGLWSFENFMTQPAMGLEHLEAARQVYVAHHNWLGVARFEMLFIILFLVFVFGTIILGIFQTKKSLKLLPKELNIFLLSGIASSAILGFFFIQQSGGANSSQFLITIDILGSIYAALACYYWIGKLKGLLKYTVIFVIVLLTIPRAIDIAHDYIGDLLYNTPLIIDNNQLQALNYIKTNTPPNSIILVDNLEKNVTYIYSNKKLLVIPINTGGTWVGNLSYYDSFLMNRSMFIDGDYATYSVVYSHGVNTEARVNVEKTVFLDKNPRLIKTLLHTNNISYIYLGSGTKLALYPPQFLKPVFKNSEITVLKMK